MKFKNNSPFHFDLSLILLYLKRSWKSAKHFIKKTLLCFWTWFKLNCPGAQKIQKKCANFVFPILIKHPPLRTGVYSPPRPKGAPQTLRGIKSFLPPRPPKFTQNNLRSNCGKINHSFPLSIAFIFFSGI